MPKIRFFLLLCLTVFSASALLSSTIDRGDDIDQKDINALREWINTKRQVTVREMGGALSLSGEVRTEFQSTSETVNGIRQRGTGGAFLRDGFPVPNNTYDVEVNIMLDYRTERGWAAIKLEFDNDAGVFSGTLHKLKLERAYWGVRAINGDTFTFDIELGRRRMSSILDSKLEFNSFFDGAWLKYDQGLDAIGDVFLHAGAFIINENKQHYGYVGETGIYNVGGTGIYLKYSLVDWDTKDFENKIERRRFDFLVSQMTLGYRIYPVTFKRAIQAYFNALYNHNAHQLKITKYKRANWGGCLGVSIGELKKKGDWAFDTNYQVLQAQAVPDFDVQGIGVGNVADTGFYTTKTLGIEANKRSNAGGNVNYRGFQVTLDYLITNQLDFQQSWQQSVTLDESIGPFRRFKQYEIEFIYGF